MRRRPKLLIISVTGAAVVMGLMLTVILVSHLMANRDVVRTFVVAKAAQATGGDLIYDRLEVGFWPLPHLKVRGIRLRRQGYFDVHARELSVFPRILPILKGTVSIRRAALVEPRVRIDVQAAGRPSSEVAAGQPVRSMEDGIASSVGSLFSGLAAIDPDTSLHVEDGALTLAYSDAPDLRICGIEANVANHDGNLALYLNCQSDLTGKVKVSANADIANRQANGKIKIADINLGPLLAYIDLPGTIAVADTQTTVEAEVTVNGPTNLNSRFDLRFPSLTLQRSGRQLTLQSVAVTGSVDLAGSRLALSIDELQSAQPPLDLSAVARMMPADAAGRSTIQINAAAQALDVAVASRVTRAIAGDLEGIQTAFDVARKGLLTNATYAVGFDVDATGWHQTIMEASGHLSRGLVTIPGIAADLEQMEGDVHYRDQQVDFSKVSGRFKGVAFSSLDAVIDWADTASLAIVSPAAVVNATTLYAWLLTFKDLAPVANYMASIEGTLKLTKLNIKGPLTVPADWHFEITGTPQDVRLASPRVPFTVGLTGGEITYDADGERASGVSVTFLDASMVSDFRSTGIVHPESMAVRLDGSLGSEAVAYLTTILPIPAHLKMNPPVALSNVAINWANTRTLTYTGTMQTAGGVDLFADLTVSPENWQVRRIQFADGSSRATASFMQGATDVSISFAGNIEKSTADRLLENNRVLSGRLEGDFRARIDTQSLLNTSFDGQLAGRGVHIPAPSSDTIDVDHFTVDGKGDQIAIAPAELSLCNSQLVVDGVLSRSGDDLTIDLNVDADRLNAELIRAIQSIGNAGSGGAAKRKRSGTPTFNGSVQIRSDEFTYGKWTWSPVQANVGIGENAIRVQIDRADLCGIGTTGILEFSPRGLDLTITPQANQVSLQETADCLWHKPVRAEARYDLAGEIHLPAGPHDPLQFMTGKLALTSQNGRITYSNVLMKVFSVLNVTEVFAGGTSDLTENGYGYSTARVAAAIGGGKIHFNEILLDGNSLKITGQGSIDLKDQQVDITLLAAPLKTVDRIVNKIPVINYIAGGSLISIPLRVHGKMENLAVATMPPSAVGQGLLNIMGRTLKAPFKLVEGAAEFASEAAAATPTQPKDTRQKGP